MKKLFLLLAVTTLGLTACKKENKTTTETEKTIVATPSTYSIDAKATQVHWTAYKTTAKKGVKGVFTTLKISNPITSKTKQGAFENLAFEIPVSSFFSKNEERDTKIKKLFFGVMDQTTLISGGFSNVAGNDTKGTMTLNLKMNGNLVPVPMTYTITNNTVTVNGTLTNLMDWKMETAFVSLHKACEKLHTGTDGVSKTWTDVAISATAVLKSN